VHSQQTLRREAKPPRANLSVSNAESQKTTQIRPIGYQYSRQDKYAERQRVWLEFGGKDKVVATSFAGSYVCFASKIQGEKNKSLKSLACSNASIAVFADPVVE
jgi:hypothetical protein